MVHEVHGACCMVVLLRCLRPRPQGSMDHYDVAAAAVLCPPPRRVDLARLKAAPQRCMASSKATSCLGALCLYNGPEDASWRLDEGVGRCVHA